MAEIKIDMQYIKEKAEGLSLRDLWIAGLLIWPITVILGSRIFDLLGAACAVGIFHLAYKNYRGRYLGWSLLLLCVATVVLLLFKGLLPF